MNTSNSTINATADHGEANYYTKMCFIDDSAGAKAGKIWAYVTIFIISLLGNSLVMHVAFKDSSSRKSVNWLIGNICIANLLITAVYMPRMMVMITNGPTWLIDGTIGLILCKLVPVTHHACLLVSILSLTALSVDRFVNVVFPTKQIFTKWQLKCLIPFMWILAVVVRFPSLYALRLVVSSNGLSICGANLSQTFQSVIARETYYTFLLVAFYATPLLAMIVLYAIVIFILRSKEVPESHYEVDSSVEAKYREARQKVLTMLITVSVTFIVCWITYFVAQIAYDKVPCSLRFWRFFLAHCNCAISPCLFLVFNRCYRNACMKTLYHVCCCCANCDVDDTYQ